MINERIEMIKQGTNPFFIAELHTGYVVIGDHQRFKGYTLFLSKLNKTELHQLDKDTRTDFLEEMALVAECVFNAFKPDKLNYELLGNKYPHLHWHIIPRYKNDGVAGPVWRLSPKELQVKLPEHEMLVLINKLKQSIADNNEIRQHIVTGGIGEP